MNLIFKFILRKHTANAWWIYIKTLFIYLLISTAGKPKDKEKSHTLKRWLTIRKNKYINLDIILKFYPLFNLPYTYLHTIALKILTINITSHYLA